jgi:hypothetical protein
MGTNIGTAEDMLKRLRSTQLTESQGAFMKKNVFQEEMKMLKRSYTEGHLSVEVMDSIGDADDDQKEGRTASVGEEDEFFGEQSLLDSCDDPSPVPKPTLEEQMASSGSCPPASHQVKRTDLERVYSMLFEKAQVRTTRPCLRRMAKL